MTIFQLGSSGDPVKTIQVALVNHGLYSGPTDGIFGGATLAAVRTFQLNNTLEVDGKVGNDTWAKLVQRDDIPPNPLAQKDLAFRCLALTGAFETGVGIPDCFCGISGDFDGQGISFGVLQWNLGQKSLQPLLRQMVHDHADITEAIFGEHFDALEMAMRTESDTQDLLEFSRSIQHPVTHRVFEPWRGYAIALGRTPEFQEIEAEYAAHAFKQALDMCEDYDIWSERAAALMFDIVTQNGSIGSITRTQILGEIRSLPASLNDEEREVRKLKIIANRRAEAANPRWVDDVRKRKLCIANGSGLVHGIRYDLEEQYAIRLAPR